MEGRGQGRDGGEEWEQGREGTGEGGDGREWRGGEGTGRGGEGTGKGGEGMEGRGEREGSAGGSVDVSAVDCCAVTGLCGTYLVELICVLIKSGRLTGT